MLFEDMLNWVVEYYSGAVTECILWDFSEADLSELTNDELRQIVLEVRKRSIDRTGGKTALVFQRDLDFGIGRVFGSFSEIEDMPFEYRSFRNITEAKKWIGVCTD